MTRLAVVTGLSGAGRSTAANALEDLGWFVVDNLPPALLPSVVELAGAGSTAVERVAAVVDLRSRAFPSDLRDTLATLRASSADTSVVFLEADDATLVRRFESVRRPHPLAPRGGLVDGVAEERRLLADVRGDADLVLDTTGWTPHALRAEVEAHFSATGRGDLQVTVLSFGYKHGLPLDADLVLDLRFLPNPHWDPELRPFTGRDPQVRERVLPAAGGVLDRWTALFDVMAVGYRREGHRFLTVAVGCTGGKHRSVAVAEELGRRLADAQPGGPTREVRVVHRDLGLE